MDAVYIRILPFLSKYDKDDIKEVLEEVLDDDEEGLLTDAEIIDIVTDILENDPPLN